MTVLESRRPANERKKITTEADSQLADFEEDALRNTLIRAAGDKLSMVAKSSAQTIGDQIQSIRQSMADFDSILERGSSIAVENEVKEINTIGKTFSYLLEMMVMQGVLLRLDQSTRAVAARGRAEHFSSSSTVFTI